MLRSTMGDDKFFKAPEEFPPTTPGNPPPPRISAVAAKRPWARICATSSSSGWKQRRARVQARIHDLPHQKGFRVQGKISQDLDTFRMPVDLKIETEGNPEDQARRSDGHVVGVFRRYVRQAEEA
jgi:hypothetical protein